jgi:glycosyltransferase involved in cell wall biosynthesis
MNGSDMNDAKYVVITPAHNEQGYIKYAIQSILSQTLKPLRWVIVSDGSTDKTKDIVKDYIGKYEFIKLINLERDGGHNFGRKSIAFKRGLSELHDIEYDYIGNLDADIYLEPGYYENVLQKFYEDKKLGIAGGIVYTKVGNSFSTFDETLDSVGGAVQLFRRPCFEAVGGLVPLEYGGEDAAAEIKAKMLGWKVRKYPEQKVFEQRRTGSAGLSLLGSKVREGQRFYSLGYDALFYLVRCIYRLKDRPYIIGSIAALYGFFGSIIRCKPILLPPQVVTHLRSEQRQRLKIMQYK